jgi:hypothetical protein
MSEEPCGLDGDEIDKHRCHDHEVDRLEGPIDADDR